jgi:hypothetical protein
MLKLGSMSDIKLLADITSLGWGRSPITLMNFPFRTFLSALKIRPLEFGVTIHQDTPNFQDTPNIYELESPPEYE